MKHQHARLSMGSLAIGSILIAGAVLLPGPATAQEPVLLERIVAIVDEEMILQSDLELALELYQLDRQTLRSAARADERRPA
jgi:hypothetical protein